MGGSSEGIVFVQKLGLLPQQPPLAVPETRETDHAPKGKRSGLRNREGGRDEGSGAVDGKGAGGSHSILGGETGRVNPVTRGGQGVRKNTTNFYPTHRKIGAGDVVEDQNQLLADRAGAGP